MVPQMIVQPGPREVGEVRSVMEMQRIILNLPQFYHHIVASNENYFVSRWLDPVVIEHAMHDVVAEEMRQMRQQMDAEGQEITLWAVGIEEIEDE